MSGLATVLALVLTSAPVDADRIKDLRQYVQTLNPSLPREEAGRLATLSYRVGRRHNLSPELLLAIARLESNLVTGTLACWPRPGDLQTCDHGLMQINDIWLYTWGLDAEELRSNDYLNMDTAARILTRLRSQFGSVEGNWFSRYHNNADPRRAAWERRLLRFLRWAPNWSYELEPQWPKDRAHHE